MTQDGPKTSELDKLADRRKDSERRSFSRRTVSLEGKLSASPDMSDAWHATIVDASLAGLRLHAPDVPDLETTELFFQPDGIDSVIGGNIVGREEDGIRIKVKIEDLDLSKLMQGSDVFAALVLETIADSPFG